MTSTIDLLYRFKGDDSDGECSSKLSVGATTLVMARKRGRLSPELAAEIAEKLGENAVFWMAVAAAEAQVEPARSKLLGLIEMDSKWRARRDSNPRPLPSEETAKWCAGIRTHDPCGIRTHDPCLRRAVLYPSELLAHCIEPRNERSREAA
jgi:hypothetical protein